MWRNTLLHVLPYIITCDLQITLITHAFGFADSEDKDGNLLPGEWRLLKENDSNNSCLVSLPHVRGSCSQQYALKARNELKVFLNSDEERLFEYIRRTSHYAL